MAYFRLTFRVAMEELSSYNDLGLYQQSHDFHDLRRGEPLSDFNGPLLCMMDGFNGKMPPFFESPAFIGSSRFCDELRKAGADSFEEFPVLIRDPERDVTIDDYRLINVIGRSDGSEADGPDLFLLQTDPACVVVSGRVRSRLIDAGYPELFFIELE